MRRAALFATLLTLAVVAAIGVGLAIIGTPAEIRAKRLDADRLRDLRNLSWAIDIHLRQTGALPRDPAEFSIADQQAHLQFSDPESGVPYTYEVTGPRSYRLCATFSHPSPKPEDDTRYGKQVPVFWRHGPGHHCFAFQVPEAPAK